MHHVCKYYIEISRYRDACGFIREGMDLTQLHFSPRRISLFLLHQVNADLVASCTNEAVGRIKIAENFINSSSEKILLTKKSKILSNDLFNLKNHVYLNYLTIYKETKYDAELTAICNEDLYKRVEVLRSTLETNRQLNDYCKEILIDIHFLVFSYLKKQQSSETYMSHIKNILKWLENVLLGFKEQNMVSSPQEKWHLAEFYCSLFECEEIMDQDHLKKAHEFVKDNPKPTLYRRICFNLFNNESDNNKKVVNQKEI